MHTEQSTQETGVNISELLARVEDDRELLREVLEIFASEMPRLEQELRDALSQGDMEQSRLTAHTMKGMLASLAFAKASESAKRIEHLARQCEPEGIAEELIRLEQYTAISMVCAQKACHEVQN